MDTSEVSDVLPSAGVSSHQQLPLSVSPFDDASSVASDHSSRQAFSDIRFIKDHVFQELLLAAVDPDHQFHSSDCQVLGRVEGTYNHCVGLKLTDGRKYVIKVPAQGVPQLWTEWDARILRSEVNTMEFLRRHTNIPIMQVFDWDDTCENHLSAPYMIQECARGIPAGKLFSVPTDDDSGPVVEESAAVLERRQIFLRDLAFNMAELQKFTFNASGMLAFDDDPDAPTVGPWYEFLLHTPKEFQPYDNTHAWLSSRINKQISNTKEHLAQHPGTDPYTMEEKVRKTQLLDGLALFCDSAYNAFPGPKLPTDAPETFVLNHPDLDFQNIYVDHTGAIVGIIDWQGTRVVPRPIGFASLPLCLCADWESDYNLQERHAPWILRSYREDYIHYLKEALAPTSCADIKFTRHSAWYWFAANAVMGYSDQTLLNFAVRTMREVEFLRVFEGTDAFLEYLRKEGQFADALEVLRREVARMYDPA
ncbi:hypothetical protein PMIN06_003631 [Paraphaeosphaeria minitans]|uniref:Aminoglycoside phosphotransferase domain-containing protein n=1 Tax=Paraphaeosphaeria minitans TaxID=565426 RepID=A0A9P6G8Z6_9PLEO|nr:hypothetical protein PMIN01_10997 [Paraphaeosphaeria minitans]